MVPAAAVQRATAARPWPVIERVKHPDIKRGQVFSADLFTVIVVRHRMNPRVFDTMIAVTMIAIHSASVLSMVSTPAVC